MIPKGRCADSRLLALRLRSGQAFGQTSASADASRELRGGRDRAVTMGAPALNRALLGAILALHVLLGLGFGLNTPLFESPDEPGHYLFVRFLQAYGRLPVQTTVFTAPRAHHPPGYYALAALLTGWASVPGSPDEIQMQVNPHFGFRAADPGNDNKAFYVQNGPDERWPYQGQALVVHG